MYKGKKILLITPALNEEDKIGRMLSKIPRDLIDDILVINDGSTDRTVEIAKKFNVKLINFKKNKGLGVAFKVGFDYIKKNGYDVGVIMGSDDQDDPVRIKEFLKAIVDEGYDMAQASRYLEKEKQEIPLFRKITTHLYSHAFSFVAGKKISDASTGYKAFKVSLVGKIDLSAKWLDSRYGIEQYFLLQTIKKGYRLKEIPVRKFFPKEGYTKMRFFIDWWYMLQPIIRSIGRK